MNHSLRVRDAVVEEQTEGLWRLQAQDYLSRAVKEEKQTERRELVLNFAASEVIARIAHTLQNTEGELAWPQQVDIRIVREAIQEVIDTIALCLLVNIDEESISARADAFLTVEQILHEIAA
ncbi:MAG TPA: hypothetical protein VJB60_02495 [Candidatus Peribacterales bacterium]|nr:hypothetical protein [Candidatus Peribacterales bacterium]